MNDPQQELFTEIRQQLVLRYGEGSYADPVSSGKVYDGPLPPAETPYPFIYLAESRQNDDMRNKSVILSQNYQDIHVWHEAPGKRGTLSQMMMTVKEICSNISHTRSYRFAYRGAQQTILEDTTTGRTLLHGVITAEYQLLGGYDS